LGLSVDHGSLYPRRRKQEAEGGRSNDEVLRHEVVFALPLV
jgi:hypothetical protein